MSEKKKVCAVCSSDEVHTTLFLTPTLECIKYLKEEISRLEQELAAMNDAMYHALDHIEKEIS